MLASAAAALALPAAAAGGAPARTVDLGSGRVDGHPVLGRTIPGVTASLGRPDFRNRAGAQYRIGWGSPRDFSTVVLFLRSGGSWRAWSIVFASGPVRDVRVGDLLGRRSPALQSAIRARYPSYEVVRPYRCRSAGFCSGELAARGGPLHLSFGTQKQKGTWLTVWRAP